VNIFVTSENPIVAAKNQCDKHVVKMVLETAQMLCAAYENGEAPYRRAHYNHPCTIWARESAENYLWLVEHGLALCEEYTARYGKTHKSEAIINWCLDNMNKIDFPSEGLTQFAVAIADTAVCRQMISDFDSMSTTEKYRAYYHYDKRRFAKWAFTSPPRWWVA